MNSWQLTFAAAGRHPPFADEATRRKAVRALGATAGAWMALFCIVDDHVHVVVCCDRTTAGRLAQAIALAMRPLESAPLRPAWITPVETRRHLEWLVRYLIGQPVKHGLPVHPALWSGSCLPDLLGARIVPGLGLRIGDALPRFRLRDAHRFAGLPEVALDPIADPVARAAGAARVVSAAASALAVGPLLEGRAPDVVGARRAAARLAVGAGIALAEVTWALSITARGARKLLDAPPDPTLDRAVRLRLALEAAAEAGTGSRGEASPADLVPPGGTRSRGEASPLELVPIWEGVDGTPNRVAFRRTEGHRRWQKKPQRSLRTQRPVGGWTPRRCSSFFGANLRAARGCSRRSGGPVISLLPSFSALSALSAVGLPFATLALGRTRGVNLSTPSEERSREVTAHL